MKNKIISIVLIVILSVCLVAQIVNAASLTVTMKSSNSNVKAGSEFTVKVSVSNLDVGKNGINSLSGYLKYDDEVFEAVDESNVEGLNKWSVSFDESTKKIEAKKNTFVKSTQDVFQMVLKTKSGATGKNGEISFSDISASNSEEDIPATDVSVSISVTEKSDDSDTNVGSSTVEGDNENNSNSSKKNTISITNSSNSIKNSNSTNTSNNNSADNTSNINVSNNSSYSNQTKNNSVVSSNVSSNNSSSNYTNTTSKDDMPKTGVSDTVFSLMLISIVVSLVFYIKFEKINKEIK